MPDQTTSIETLLQEGESYLSAGDKANALECFESARQLDAGNARAWLGIAQATSDREEAVEAFDRVVHLDPGNLAARDLSVALQVSTLKEGVQSNIPAYRDPRWQPFIRPGLIGLGLLALVALIVFGRGPFENWYRANIGVSAAGVPTLEARALPATWTPVPTSSPTATRIPTSTPVPTSTPSIVRGRINATASARSGPGAAFSIVKTLSEPTLVTLNAISVDSKYYRLVADGDTASAWVSTAFVSVTSGNTAILQVIDVPTPVPTKVPPPPRVIVPPSPTPALLFRQSKDWRNPYGPRCDRTFIHGTVWNEARLEPAGAVAGVQIWLWVNGAVVARDVTGSHNVPNVTVGYWEVSFPAGQAVSGVAAVVSNEGQRLSAQFPFAFSGGNCQEPSSINEIILDFERIH